MTNALVPHATFAVNEPQIRRGNPWGPSRLSPGDGNENERKGGSRDVQSTAAMSRDLRGSRKEKEETRQREQGTYRGRRGVPNLRGQEERGEKKERAK